MTPEERAVVQAQMDQLIASGLIKFANPLNSREWRVVGPRLDIEKQDTAQSGNWPLVHLAVHRSQLAIERNEPPPLNGVSVRFVPSQAASFTDARDSRMSYRR